MATGEKYEIVAGYEFESVDPEIDEGEGLDEGNLSEDLSLPVKAEEESTELEKEDLYLDRDPERQIRSKAEKDLDYYARYHATINSVPSYGALRRLAQRIEKSKNVVFLSTAEEVLKYLEDWLLKSIPIPLCPLDFSSKMFGVWKDGSLVDDVRLTIEEDPPELSLHFVNMSKEDSLENRMTCMKFDDCLKTVLEEIKSDKTDQFATFNTIRLFSRILIAHWTNEEVLTDLEKGMGKNHFKETYKRIAVMNAKMNAATIAFNKKNVQREHEHQSCQKRRLKR